MTKQELYIFLEALRYFIEDCNDAVADDDRGRANDALCLVLYDDGSGMIGTMGMGIPAPTAGEMNVQCAFATIEHAVDFLADWLVEQEKTPL